MAAFADSFALAETASGDVVTATGDWHGEAGVTVNACFIGGERDKAVAVLAMLHGDWPAWCERLIAALDVEEGAVADIRLVAVHAYDGDDVEDYFEIEFTSPAVFGDDMAMAVGTLAGGIEDVGVSG